MIKLPESIKLEMDKWRSSMIGFPQVYTMFHKDCARKDIAQRDNWKVLEDHGLVNDGWGDGAQFIQIVVAVNGDNGWTVLTLKWHESGAWFEKMDGGGWGRFAEMIK